LAPLFIVPGFYSGYCAISGVAVVFASEKLNSGKQRKIYVEYVDFDTVLIYIC
jgi:hypothetical protein